MSGYNDLDGHSLMGFAFFFNLSFLSVSDMAFLISWPGAVFLFVSLFSSLSCVIAANSTEKLPTFGDVIPILGAVSCSPES